MRDAQFLRAATDRRIKIAVPGPFTLAQLAQDEYYRDDARLAMAYAEGQELARSAAAQVSLEAAQPRLDLATLAPLAAASKTIVLGVLDLGDPAPETADTVASRIREALQHVPRERLVAAPDCGMKYLGRATALEKLRALAEGARLV